MLGSQWIVPTDGLVLRSDRGRVAMGGIFDNPLHLALLIVVIVLLFGASKLGDVGGALGKSIREFKKEANKEDERKLAQIQSPPASGYVPPVTQSLNTQAPSEPLRHPEYTPGDYRPSSSPQAPPAAGAAPPDYSGR